MPKEEGMTLPLLVQEPTTRGSNGREEKPRPFVTIETPVVQESPSRRTEGSESREEDGMTTVIPVTTEVAVAAEAAAEVAVAAKVATEAVAKEATEAAKVVVSLPLPDLLISTVSNNHKEVPVGGRLALFKDHWDFCKWSCSIVSNGLGWKWIKKPPKLHRFYQQPTPFLEEYVKDLLARKVIKPVKSLSFQGRLFCVPKKNSPKMRVILDLSPLNKYIQCDKFQMLTIAQIRTLLPQGAYAISIDLTDAYWNVPVAPHFSLTLALR